MAKLTATQVIESLKEMTILELNDLVKAIEEEFGVTAAAPASAVAAVAAPVEEEVKDVSVILKEVGPSKVGVIKVVREITGLGLVEAKGLVDKAPIAIKENLKPEAADEIKAKLVEAGATVEIK
ncbi:MAG: 50S ribosomal protein L7/L12 [Erysipelothrix sp.]|jgi:large subunit ribosomal protein L7/L12|nr:50S ribosomal protein L7/L12 [Erysipelothrix sp.]